GGTIEGAGPEVSDFPTIARRIAVTNASADSAVSTGARKPRVPTIVPIPIPGPLSADGLIPDSPRLSAVTVEDWLRTR
ncbi:MAG: hypothetical protein L0J03_14545, partial [Brevibacterium sp.]|nr:hypothetical protein [Brevibacterium sp.]